METKDINISKERSPEFKSMFDFVDKEPLKNCNLGGWGEGAEVKSIDCTSQHLLFFLEVLSSIPNKHTAAHNHLYIYVVLRCCAGRTLYTSKINKLFFFLKSIPCCHLGFECHGRH